MQYFNNIINFVVIVVNPSVSVGMRLDIQPNNGHIIM